jgi:adenosylhomocysteine nucleosidase
MTEGIDLVDMEGYAVARVAQNFGLDAMLVKQISDSACELAGRSWSKNVDHCAEQLGAWLGAEFSAS